MFFKLIFISLAATDMIPPNALQKASSKIEGYLIKKKFPSITLAIAFIKSSL
jgi:hypothetical protein